MIGRVVSNKMIKTAVVLIESHKVHPLYKKPFTYSKKYLVDDQLGVKIGDIVEFVKVAPISKRKHWKITKLVGKDIVAVASEELKAEAKVAIEEVLPVETQQVEAEVEVEVPVKKASKKGATK